MASPLVRPTPSGANEPLPYAVPFQAANRSIGGALNQAATVVLAADTLRGHIISSVFWSYRGTTTPTGRVTIEDSNGILFDADVTRDGHDQADFNPPLLCATSSAVTITAAAGGAAATGKVGSNCWRLV